jgi:hypothetical protein
MTGNMGLGFGPNPMRFPLNSSLGHLANLANVMSYTLHGFFELPYKLISFIISLSLLVQTNAKPKLIKQLISEFF